MSSISPIRIDEEPGKRPLVSIIIPTRNRCSILARCLAALPQGARGLPTPEVIVSDDCSSDDTEKVIRRFCAESGWLVRHLRQDLTLGANAARNSAVRLARGEVLAFIDDDVLVEEGWLLKLLSGLSAEFPVVSGPVRLMAEGPILGKHREEIQAVFGEVLEPPAGFDGAHVPVLCNLAACRKVFEKAFFDESIRPPVEEADWLRRVGARSGFVSDALVWHYKTQDDFSPKRVLPNVWRRGQEGGWWVRERATITARECRKLAARSARTSLRAFGHALVRRCWGGVVIGVGEMSKALSRVTEPSAGWADIRGSLGSLLEVGSGFHPELTGRENIYLNGAILGMGRREISRKFDEIVHFAEVGSFLDTPLKHYSSGMQTRLAFAVAAHLEPEILLVDEVLAVGDLAFQKKCLGKMDEVARGGRTIVFVSHQMNQIRRLCGRVIWIDQGRLREDGPVAQVVASYESAMARGEQSERQGKDFEAKTRFVRWHIGAGSEINAYQLESLGQVTVHFDLQLEHAIQRGHHGIALLNMNRELVWGRAIDNLRLEPGLHRISYTFSSLPLRPGPYFWQVSLWEDGNCFDIWDCLPQMIVATPNFQHPRDEWSGLLNIPSEARVTDLREIESPHHRAPIDAKAAHS